MYTETLVAELRDPSHPAHARAVRIVEQMRALDDAGNLGPARHRILVVRDALEAARKNAAAIENFGPDRVREWACKRDAELWNIPLEAWSNAIASWPGIRRGRGGVRRSGERSTTWSDVVFHLLAPYGLTAATSAASLRETFEGARRRSRRPSRAKR